MRSGGDKRGSSKDRRARKLFLLSTPQFGGNGESVPCVWCSVSLTLETVEADRIIPGSKGGTYRRDNVQPACRHCNASRQDNDAPKELLTV